MCIFFPVLPRLSKFCCMCVASRFVCVWIHFVDFYRYAKRYLSTMISNYEISNNHIALFNDILMLLLMTLNCSSGGFVGYRLSYVDIWPIGAFQRDCISTRPTARWIGI